MSYSILDGFKQNAEDSYQQAVASMDAGCAEDAVHQFRRAVSLDPRHARAWNDLGVLMDALENHRDALSCYQAALEADPTLVEARSNFCMLTLALDLEKALRSQPRRPSLVF